MKIKNLQWIQNTKGSLLVEVLLAVVILSVSLTLIIQSMASSLRATVYSTGYSMALLLMENRLFHILYLPVTGAYAQESGQFPQPYNRYHYDLTISGLTGSEDLKKISQVDLDVSWSAKGAEKKISLATYQMNALEEVLRGD